jgi:hypothetical protein
VLAFEAFEFVRPGWVRFDKLAELRSSADFDVLRAA